MALLRCNALKKEKKKKKANVSALAYRKGVSMATDIVLRVRQD